MNKLQELRKRTGYSQSELSKITGISIRYLQEVEGGRKNLNKMAGDTLYKLSLALRCDILDILDTVDAKQEAFENIADFLADIEMDSGSHADEPEDYDSELDFYLSNAEGDGYIVYLTDNWVDTEEDAIAVQDMVMDKIRERVNE